MPKTNSPSSEFSREREIKVILEDMQGQFRVFGEGLQDVREKVSILDQKVTKLDHKVTELDLKVTALDHKVTALDHKVTGLDHRVTGIDQRLTNVERDVSFIKMALPTIATKDDVFPLEKRVTVLEKTG